MRKKFLTFLLAAGLPVLAHHAFSSEFDSKKPLELTGTVSKVEWREPHVHLFINVKNEAGKNEEWQLETASPLFLQKQGLKAGSFSKGMTVKVNGYQALTKPHLLSARMIELGGKGTEVADVAEDGGPAK